MSKNKGGWGPYEFTRSAFDEAMESERSLRVHWFFSLEMSAQRGIWVLHIDVYGDAGKKEHIRAAVYQWEWPNAQSMTFESFLYTSCYRVARMVEAWALDRDSKAALAL